MNTLTCNATLVCATVLGLGIFASTAHAQTAKNTDRFSDAAEHGYASTRVDSTNRGPSGSGVKPMEKHGVVVPNPPRPPGSTNTFLEWLFAWDLR